MDIAVERNAYGRQIDSRVANIDADAEFASAHAPGEMEAVFIRAPIIRASGPGARVLARIRWRSRAGRSKAATWSPHFIPS